MEHLSHSKEWQALLHHQRVIGGQHMREMFANDPTRFPRYAINCDELLMDYSRNRINDHTLTLLANLASSCNLKQKIHALFEGKLVNVTEKRPALHTAFRNLGQQSLWVNGENITPLITKTQAHMHAFAAQIHDQTWLGITGKPIKHVVNIGIGGSHLGPKMCIRALAEFNIANLNFHFISTVDKANLQDVLQQIDLETTLFIVSSKTFTTIETMTNAKTILQMMKEKWGNAAIKKHFIAVTSKPKRAIDFGIDEGHIFPMWDWVGGRYSIWSAIGLPLLLLLGREQYKEFLTGGHRMDEHFKHAPFAANMPVLLALLGIWYMNFFGSAIKAIVPYSHHLRYFVPYVQQAYMESNGKSVCVDGSPANYAMGTVIFGEEGCDGQHAYHQMLLQGQHLIPVDFILIGKALTDTYDIHHQVLTASCLSQAQALMQGKRYTEAYDELIQQNYDIDEAEKLAHHRVIPGNRPSNILFLNKLSPKNLGALIALYEHKIFVQSAIWDINPFDQWGVELGKQLLPSILQSFQENDDNDHFVADPATTGLINHVKTIIES